MHQIAQNVPTSWWIIVIIWAKVSINLNSLISVVTVDVLKLCDMVARSCMDANAKCGQNILGVINR